MNSDVQAYFDAVPDERKGKVQQLHALVLGAFPDAAISLDYRMPTYRVGDGWVAIANQKSYVSLYTCAAIHLELFKQQYPGIKTGKGCINFRAGDTIPEAATLAVIESAIRNPKGHDA